MFRGNWTNCVRIIPNSAVKFLAYEQLSRLGSGRLLPCWTGGHACAPARVPSTAVQGTDHVHDIQMLHMLGGWLLCVHGHTNNNKQV